MLTVIYGEYGYHLRGQSFSFSIGLTPIPKISEEPASSSPLSDLEVTMSYMSITAGIDGMSVQRVVHPDFNSIIIKI